MKQIYRGDDGRIYETFSECEDADRAYFRRQRILAIVERFWWREVSEDEIVTGLLDNAKELKELL